MVQMLNNKMGMFRCIFVYGAILVLSIGAEWNKYMEDPSLYEGDMVLNDEQKAMLHSYAITKKGGYYKHWPYGQPIPYEMDPKFESSQYHKKKLEDAMKDYEKNTCLRFVRRSNTAPQKQYIRFVPGSGCSSYVGLQRSVNYITLAGGCFSRGTLLHEIAHSLGVLHEQSRPDRDKYIKVHYENLKCCKSQFTKRGKNDIDSLGFPYDYQSMMHYGSYAFSNGSRMTIEVLQKGAYIGQRRGFSKIDIAQINKMYKCGGLGIKTTMQPSPTLSPQVGFVLAHLTSDKCLEVRSDRLVFSKSCSTKFLLTSGGNLMEVATGKCGYTESTNNDAGIRFSFSTCQDSFRQTQISGKSYALQHVQTSKCIHPKKGSPKPLDGTQAVIYKGCGGDRLKFKEA